MPKKQRQLLVTILGKLAVVSGVSMETMQLGSVTLSRVVQGFWRLTGWNMRTEELTTFMRDCIERGVTSFDTAEIYGNTECERQMGLAFAQDSSLRNKVQIISKTGISQNGDFSYYDTTYERIKASCVQSIERLQCEYLDVYLIHREDPCLDPWEAGRALLDLKRSGLVREIGVSNFDPFKFNALNTAVEGTLVTNQIEWNPLCFEHFESGMMDLLLEKKIHPMIWSPLAGGSLFTDGPMQQKVRNVLKTFSEKYAVDESTIVYAWLMYHPVGALPISGSNKTLRLEQAVKALDIKLEHWEWYQIYTASGQKILR